jgi:hypothetical protein
MKKHEALVQALSGFGFYSALIKIAWSIVLLLPDNTFAANPNSYASMMAIATEEQWAIYLLIVGILHTTSVLFYSLRFRITMQVLSVGTWLFIATQFWVSNPIGTGKITYGIAAIIDFIVIVYLLKFNKGR